MEASTCLEKLVGNSTVGVVLKDVSLEVHGGELMAVLGSKGKRQNSLPCAFKKLTTVPSLLYKIIDCLVEYSMSTQWVLSRSA